jgi:hypothetical protein
VWIVDAQISASDQESGNSFESDKKNREKENLSNETFVDKN